ncbi:MAG: hypothetical protein EOM59_09975 [Clostridia bacterium]|nr:hypothetical protein [Clostridia bacterium]
MPFNLKFKKSKPKTITVYFGVPGSGKTTLAALFTRKALKHGETVYSNVPIIGSYKYNPVIDLGVFQIEDCLLLLDEASLEFNNRNYKSFPKTCIEFFKLHRHYGVAVDVFSQSYEDMDVTIRRLATKFIVVRKSIFPYLIATRAAKAIIDIDQESKQFVSGYEWAPFSRRWHFMPVAWKLFDSYDAPILKNKQWQKWRSKNVESST